MYQLLIIMNKNIENIIDILEQYQLIFSRICLK